MTDFVGSRILFDPLPSPGRPRRLRRFLAIAALATVVLAMIWATVAGLMAHRALLVGDLVLIAVGSLVLALLRAGRIQTAVHVQLICMLIWIPTMSALVSGSGVNHDGAVHYWLFVVIVGLHFVLFDAGRVIQTFYASVAILLFIVIEYELVALDPRYAFVEHRRLFTHGLTLGLVLIAVVLIMRTFINGLAEAERRAAAALHRSKQLLNSVLPPGVATRLESKGMTFAERFDECSILFADVVGFTPLAASMSPEALVGLLNRLFTRFDVLTEQHGLEKIKTIGDGYMAAAGIPEPNANHAVAVAELALDMLAAIEEFEGLSIRIGIHTGPVVAGIIGQSRFSYDLWGETVNVASRMESHGLDGSIQVSRAVHDLLASGFRFEPRGVVDVKGAGSMEVFLLHGRASLP